MMVPAFSSCPSPEALAPFDGFLRSLCKVREGPHQLIAPDKVVEAWGIDAQSDPSHVVLEQLPAPLSQRAVGYRGREI
jgi:hypothetical protein